jgi:tetraacyldisaccharide 4'-kinase
MNLQSFWSRKGLLNYLLLPLSWLFGAVVATRRWLYRRGWRPAGHPGVPVLVVGNLGAGGSGKTPFVIWLVTWLRGQGYRPGVVSRGYGRQDRGVRRVTAQSTAAEVGDEPLLIQQATGAPVAVGASRLAAARLLLAGEPGVDVIVSDDGLQHYALARNLELVLADGVAGFGNGWLLPAGPLREPRARLAEADALIVTERDGAASLPAGKLPVFAVRLSPAGFVNLRDGHRRDALAAPATGEIEAVTGIARPEQFFALLARLGVRHRPRPFPDHHAFTAADMDAGAAVVMTAKDAVKCRPFAGPDWWALELALEPGAGLESWLAGRLSGIERGTFTGAATAMATIKAMPS